MISLTFLVGSVGRTIFWISFFKKIPYPIYIYTYIRLLIWLVASIFFLLMPSASSKFIFRMSVQFKKQEKVAGTKGLQVSSISHFYYPRIRQKYLYSSTVHSYWERYPRCIGYRRWKLTRKDTKLILFDVILILLGKV